MLPFPRWPWLSEFSSECVDLLWPRVCDLCAEPIRTPVGRVICTRCRAKIADDPWETCPRCSGTVGPHSDTSQGCPACKNEKFAFCGVTRMGPYDGLLREAILRIKWRNGEVLAQELGEVFGDQLRARGFLLPDVIVPVPLHWRRRWERGHNQSLAIARGLAKSLGIKFQPRWLIRQKNTPKQTSVSATQRRENIRGAFRLSRGVAVQNLRVLLVDDVLTTGATAQASSLVFCAAGAAQVSVAVLAHR
jgi:ComF family protein